MSPLLISILLWIPFALTALTAGIFFCISGYRKGLWRALIGLGAVIVAAGVSILLAWLGAMLIAPPVTNLALSMVGNMGGNGMAMGIMEMVVQSGVQVGLAMGLFFLLMLMFTIIFRVVGYRVKHTKLITTGKGLKLAGMAVGAAAALLFAFLWMMPLYGSVAAYAPVVEDVMGMAMGSASQSGQPDPEAVMAKTYLNAVTSQPLVKAYNTAPAQAVYGSIARVSAGGTTVSLSTMTQTIQTVMEKVALISDAPVEQRPAMLKELVDYVRSDVITQNWCYAMFREAIGQLRDAAEQILAAAPGADGFYTFSSELPYTASALSAVSSVIPATEGGEGDVFYFNGGAESDGTFYYDFDGDGVIVGPEREEFVPEDILEGEFVTVTPGIGSIFGGASVIPDSYVPDSHDILIAKLLLEFTDIMDVTQEEFVSNCDNLLGFVSYALEHDFITIMNDEDIGRLYETGIMEKAGKLANSSEEAVRLKRLIALYVLTRFNSADYDTSEAFLARYPITQLTDPQQQLVEAELIFDAMAFSRVSPVDFLLKHPSFGSEALTEVLGDKGDTAILSGLSSWQQEALAKYLKEDPELPQKLMDEVKKNIGTPGAPSLNEYFNAMNLVLSCAGLADGASYEDPHPMALDFALEYVGKIPFVRGGEETEQLYALLIQYSAAQKDSPYAYRNSAGFSMLLDMMANWNISGGEEHVTWYTRCIIEAESTWNVIECALSVYGDDPIRLSKSLDEDYRKELGEVFSSFSENFNRYEPEVVEYLADEAGMTVADYLAMMQQRADKLKVFFACP